MESMVNKEFWKNKRVFVTGATGLVGTWLTKALVDTGAYVVVLMHDWDPQSDLIRSGTINDVSVVNGELQSYADIERAINEHEIDSVFHLGAQAIVGTALRNPLPTFEANIRGTYNLLEACRVHSSMVKRVVIASSDKSYGTCDVLPYSEEMPSRGNHPYDVSKSCTDLLSQTYYNTYDLPVVIARCGNIYGGGDLNWSRIIPGTVRCLYSGENPVIRSDGTFLRDYVFIQDAVEAYIVMAQSLGRVDVRGEAFNFGPMSPLSVVEVVNAVSKIMGREDLEPQILNTAKAEIRDQYLSSKKAKKVLQWSPRYDLETGLLETVSWYMRYFKEMGFAEDKKNLDEHKSKLQKMAEMNKAPMEVL